LQTVYQPLVSILTPTWNRGPYLRRVWEGLNSQIYKHIEWIVANDGSSDGTENIIRELAALSEFPVTLISASLRIGKARMDNEAIAQARGEFILWNDSDDYLLPRAIERLIAAWDSIPPECKDEFVGITALCDAGKGGLSIALPQSGHFDTTWNDLSETHNVIGDMLYFTKASALKKERFPEIDFVIPEGVVWSALGHMKTRVLPEILKVNEYRTPNSISFSGKMEYNRGRAYALAISENNLRMYPRRPLSRLWKLINYIRYSMHGEIEPRGAIKLWGENSSLFAFFLVLPIAYLFSLKDRAQGKVRKTHREFLAAQRRVVITHDRASHL
jgi:glycosyltransferase involved in cell wall biosynthesis